MPRMLGAPGGGAPIAGYGGGGGGVNPLAGLTPQMLAAQMSSGGGMQPPPGFNPNLPFGGMPGMPSMQPTPGMPSHEQIMAMSARQQAANAADPNYDPRMSGGTMSPGGYSGPYSGSGPMPLTPQQRTFTDGGPGWNTAPTGPRPPMGDLLQQLRARFAQPQAAPPQAAAPAAPHIPWWRNYQR
jgi:hypothetical protein